MFRWSGNVFERKDPHVEKKESEMKFLGLEKKNQNVKNVKISAFCSLTDRPSYKKYGINAHEKNVYRKNSRVS